jgi:hypothetical protein
VEIRNARPRIVRFEKCSNPDLMVYYTARLEPPALDKFDGDVKIQVRTPAVALSG